MSIFPKQQGREILIAARTYYVNAAFGNDSYNGLSVSTPFRTVQKAVDTIASLDINGQTVTIQLADGSYLNQAVTLKNVAGFLAAGNLVIQGNHATPSNVLLSPNIGDGFIKDGAGSVWDIRDMKISIGNSGNCLNAINGGYIRFENIDFGVLPNLPLAHIRASGKGIIVATGNYTVSGGAYIHSWADSGAFINIATRTIVFSNAPVFSYFAVFETTSFLFAYAMTFTNGGTVTGQKHLGTLNAATQTNGVEATYFPGTIAGVRTTGAQWG